MPNDLRLKIIRCFPSRNKTSVVASKYYGNADIKFFWLCPVLLDLYTLFHVFFFFLGFEALPGLSTAPSPSKNLERRCFPVMYREMDPVDTGRKLKLHKTFRRRPRRRIYVLCLRGIVWNMCFFKLFQTLEQRLKSFLAVLLLHLIV